MSVDSFKPWQEIESYILLTKVKELAAANTFHSQESSWLRKRICRPGGFNILEVTVRVQRLEFAAHPVCSECLLSRPARSLVFTLLLSRHSSDHHR